MENIDGPSSLREIENRNVREIYYGNILYYLFYGRQLSLLIYTMDY